MIQQEELHIKQFTTGVTFFIFSDAIYNQLPENPDQYEGPFPSYVVYNMQGEIYSLNYFTGNVIWTRNENNNYIPIEETGWNYKTGYTLVKTVASNMSQENIDNMSSLMLQRLSNPDRLGTPPSASAATNYVFFSKQLIDDFYVDLKLERSYNSLDTLKIYNNLINSFPEQESPTGVVFGRLTAIQKIKNENGENLRIPLQNVPLGVFNPSDDYPQIFSTDDNGDRLTLNIKESSVPSDYFDNISYYTDYDNYLRSAESFSGVPAQYKYITKTNENGEFILYDIPVGQQVVVFEVDLFKQGLTKDEIALNFFPFPPTEDPNIDTIPSFAYKQFPIDVVPAWGRGQTGYTSLDININLDLRKWTTYIIPPVTYNSQKLNLTTAQSPSRALKVDIRDMTSPGFTKRPIEIVQIPDDLDRDIGAKYLWFNEFTQKKTSIQYQNFGCSVFKLPANVYDPAGYKTDINGNPTTNKGVWLASYQFNIYLEKLFSQRASGAVYYQTTQGRYIRSHYHLNYTEGNLLDGSADSAGSQVGVFPYEKPWSATYPEKYSIPKKPTQQRVLWGGDRLLYPGSTPTSPKYYIEEPAYSDGDLVGNPVYDSAGEVGGFGVQFFGSSWFYNRIANVATKKYMYKYESGVSSSEIYANGYEPYWDSTNNPYPYNDFPFAGLSKVVGGEKYQRLESGYGYFIKPQGWGRIVRETWSADIPKDTNFLAGFGTSDDPGPATVPSGLIADWFYRKPYPVTMYNIDNQNFALHLGAGTSIKEGTLDFYRIVDSGPDENGNFINIAPVESFTVPTYSNLKIEGAFQCWSIQIKNQGIVAVNIRNPFRGTVRVFKQNATTPTDFVYDSEDQYFGPGELFTLEPGSSFITQDAPASLAIYDIGTGPNQSYFRDPVSNFREINHPNWPGTTYARDNVSFTNISLPGNTSFSDDNQNIFLNARYDVFITYYDKTNGSVSYVDPATNTLKINPSLSIGNIDAIYDALNQSRTFSQDYKNFEAISNSYYSNLVGGLAPITRSFSFNGAANISGNNNYYIRTGTNGGSNGLIHEGIGKHFYYGDDLYYEENGITLYSMRIEGPTSSLWGEFNDGSEDYGFGRKAP